MLYAIMGVQLSCCGGDMKLKIGAIIDLAGKICSLESEKDVLPQPTAGADRQRLIANKSIKNYRAFTKDEVDYLIENKTLFPKKSYPKLHTWLQDTSKVLGDEFKEKEPAIKLNKEYPLLPTLKIMTTLSKESSFFDDAELESFHHKLGQFIDSSNLEAFAKKVFALMIHTVASDVQQPLHDLYIKLNFPADEKKWDREKWYDLVLKTSSKALVCLTKADEIEELLKCVPDTLEDAMKALAQVGYKRQQEVETAENLPSGVTKEDIRKYSLVCIEKGVPEVGYNKGLDILLGNEVTYQDKPRKIKSTTNIPHVKIDGNDIAYKYGEPKLAQYRLEVLPVRDWRKLVAGELTNCCQSVGNEGENCAIEAMTNPDTDIVAIFKGDKIVAQSFVWFGKDDNKGLKTFVFDSWERLNDNLNFLCVPFYNEMASILKKNHSIGKVTLGIGGNTPKDIFPIANIPARYRDGKPPYQDADQQVCLLDQKINPDFNCLFFAVQNLIERAQAKDLAEYLNNIKDKDISRKILSGFVVSAKALCSMTIESNNSEVVQAVLNEAKAIDPTWVFLQEFIVRKPYVGQSLLNHATQYLESLKTLIAAINQIDAVVYSEEGIPTFEFLKQLLRARGSGGNTPLLEAIDKQAVASVKFLLSEADKVGDVYDEQFSLSYKFTQELLDETNNNGYNALHIAVSKGDVELVKLILAKAREIDPTLAFARRLLELETKRDRFTLVDLGKKYPKVIQILFDEARSVDPTNQCSRKLINISDSNHANGAENCATHDCFESLQIIFEEARRIDPTNEYSKKLINNTKRPTAGRNLLEVAIERGHYKCVKFMFEEARRIDPTNEYSRSLFEVRNNISILRKAALCAHLDVAELVLDELRLIDPTSSLLLAIHSAHGEKAFRFNPYPQAVESMTKVEDAIEEAEAMRDKAALLNAVSSTNSSCGNLTSTAMPSAKHNAVVNCTAAALPRRTLDREIGCML